MSADCFDGCRRDWYDSDSLVEDLQGGSLLRFRLSPILLNHEHRRSGFRQTSKTFRPSVAVVTRKPVEKGRTCMEELLSNVKCDYAKQMSIKLTAPSSSSIWSTTLHAWTRPLMAQLAAEA